MTGQAMSEQAAEPSLPRLRQDLKLYPGSAHRDGSPSWRILDPVRNRFFEIGWLEFELLARWNEHTAVASLIEQVGAETPMQPSEEEVEGFVAFLADNQLIVPDGRESLGRLRARWLKAERPWYERLFHNYLFFRVPLVRPDKFLERSLPVVGLFYSRVFAALVLLVFLADLYLLSREFDELRRTFLYFFNLQGGLYFLLAATFSKVVHEFAHAYTAKRYGVRVPAMGIAFLVMWPFLYTDTSETWKLADRKKQLAIASAGIVSELVLACFATLLWVVTPEGFMKNVFFILATTTWVMTLAINASPFMRFDGYFVVSDALDFPNLHERSFACARWWIRTRFFGLEEPLPEATLPDKNRRALIGFALGVWLYRFVVFLGIALLVYHTFFKLLGIVLMILEVVWFILRPVAAETKYLWQRRQAVRLRWGPIGALGAALLLLLWLVPVAREVTAPAVLLAEHEQALYAPFPARIASVEVRPGDRVQPEQVLVRLDAPELDLRARNAEVALATAKAEYLRGAATAQQLERRSMLQERVSQAQAEQQAVREDAQRLELRATTAGQVRDLSAQIVPGRWIGSRELMLRVVSPESAIIEAYVTDSQVDSVVVGQEVKFVSTVPGVPVVKGRVKAVDTTARKEVSRLLLAAPYGGDIPAVLDRHGAAVAQSALYRVVIEPLEPVKPGAFVVRGVVRIHTDLVLVAQNFLWRTLSLIVRETGL
jgi:putative peptide zinc metalloprotease protein